MDSLKKLSPNRAKPNSAPQKPKEIVIDSEDFLQGGKVVFIQHGEQRYQLRSTKENKLILTK